MNFDLPRVFGLYLVILTPSCFSKFFRITNKFDQKWSKKLICRWMISSKPTNVVEVLETEEEEAVDEVSRLNVHLDWFHEEESKNEGAPTEEDMDHMLGYI